MDLEGRNNMAKYPIKMLLDEKKNPFFPVVTIDTVLVNETEQTAADMFADRYTKAEIDKIIADLGTLQRLCGKVNSIEALPNNARPGDTYIVTDASGNNSEYMYIGDKWEELGPMIDLSGYDTSEEVDAKLSSLKDNVNETAETNSAEALKQAQQYADTKAATLATDALTDAKAYTDEVIAQAGTGASLKSVPADEYTAGMEQSNPILVVYKQTHVIDPNTDLVLNVGGELNSMQQPEFKYKVVSTYGDEFGPCCDMVAENTSEDKVFKTEGVSLDVYDKYGTQIGNGFVQFANAADGTNIFKPGDSSGVTTVRTYAEAHYAKIVSENIMAGTPMVDPELSSNIVMLNGIAKTSNTMVVEALSYDNSVAVIKVTNPSDTTKYRYPNFNIVFQDQYCMEVHISQTYDFFLKPGESILLDIFTPIFYTGVFSQSVEAVPEAELQPYHLVPEVGNEVVAGDFKYTLEKFEIGSGGSELGFKVTNLKDFSIQAPIGEWTLGFHVFDKWAGPLGDMIGYVPNTLTPNGEQWIGSAIDVDLSNAAFIEFDSTFFTPLNPAEHLIPVAGSKLVTPDGSLELEYVSHETVAGTSTLHLKVTNLTDAEIAVDDKVVLCNPIGQELATLVIFAGMLGAGQSSTTSSSYSGNAIGDGLYYIVYRKENE